MIFRVETETKGREVYMIEAETPEDATKIFQLGGLEPKTTEVLEAEVVDVEEWE